VRDVVVVGGGGGVDGGLRGVDGPTWSPQDRAVLHPHALLRAGDPAAVLLQA
jgi:hypothetical protein